ncbi:hypothetical protein VNO77_19068 [Canavalia gladiata]|uniref:Uncharacterized protein n=1 Tax=Canavalia gladiata TaxID=3824 RepID=A0AAN9LQP6_CANGL
MGKQGVVGRGPPDSTGFASAAKELISTLGAEFVNITWAQGAMADISHKRLDQASRQGGIYITKLETHMPTAIRQHQVKSHPSEPAKNSTLISVEVPFLLQGLSVIVPPGRMIRVSFH